MSFCSGQCRCGGWIHWATTLPLAPPRGCWGRVGSHVPRSWRAGCRQLFSPRHECGPAAGGLSPDRSVGQRIAAEARSPSRRRHHAGRRWLHRALLMQRCRRAAGHVVPSCEEQMLALKDQAIAVQWRENPKNPTSRLGTGMRNIKKRCDHSGCNSPGKPMAQDFALQPPLDGFAEHIAHLVRKPGTPWRNITASVGS